MAVLTLYIWMDEYWLAAYSVPDYPGEAKKISRLLRFHPTSLALGVTVIVVATGYKKFFAPGPTGFPGYFVFLVVGGLVPAASFFPTARPFINWRAFSITLFFILLVSLLWEVTLVVPYGWLEYRESQMLGVFIGAWSRLPIEAAFVRAPTTTGGSGFSYDSPSEFSVSSRPASSQEISSTTVKTDSFHLWPTLVNFRMEGE